MSPPAGRSTFLSDARDRPNGPDAGSNRENRPEIDDSGGRARPPQLVSVLLLCRHVDASEGTHIRHADLFAPFGSRCGSGTRTGHPHEARAGGVSLSPADHRVGDGAIADIPHDRRSTRAVGRHRGSAMLTIQRFGAGRPYRPAGRAAKHPLRARRSGLPRGLRAGAGHHRSRVAPCTRDRVGALGRGRRIIGAAVHRDWFSKSNHELGRSVRNGRCGCGGRAHPSRAVSPGRLRPPSGTGLHNKAREQ